jgi:hypothetical protein
MVLNIKEIGDGSSKPYKWVKVNDIFSQDSGNRKFSKEYSFTTESGMDYIVGLDLKDKILTVDFMIDSMDGNEYQETNKGELFKVMSTISSILREIIDKYKSITKIKYFPKSKIGKQQNQRDRLYKIYLKKEFPNVTFEKNHMGDTVAILNESSLKIKKSLMERIIFEIGDGGAKTYKYKGTRSSPIEGKSKYTFTTDSEMDYSVSLEIDDGYLEVDFSVWGQYAETNKGEMFDVMTTIVAIIKEDLSKIQIPLKGIKYFPSLKRGGETIKPGINNSQNKRDKLYRAYIKKAFPNATFRVRNMATYADFNG